MKITIEKVENGYIMRAPAHDSDREEVFVFEEDDGRLEHSGFDAHCLRDALSQANHILSGGSDFDKNVVSVILERGDEWSPEGESHEE